MLPTKFLVHLFIYQYELIFFYFIQWGIIHYMIYLDTQTVLDVVSGKESFQAGFCVLLTWLLHFGDTSLLSGTTTTTKIQAHLLSLSEPVIRLIEPWWHLESHFSFHLGSDTSYQLYFPFPVWIFSPLWWQLMLNCSPVWIPSSPCLGSDTQHWTFLPLLGSDILHWSFPPSACHLHPADTTDHVTHLCRCPPYPTSAPILQCQVNPLHGSLACSTLHYLMALQVTCSRSEEEELKNIHNSMICNFLKTGNNIEVEWTICGTEYSEILHNIKNKQTSQFKI